MGRLRVIATIVAGAAALAAAMLIANLSFELVGSVPDIPSCGFLAGNLIVLFLLYPALAAAVSGRASATLMRSSDLGDREIAMAGACVGLGGSVLYFGLALIELIQTPQVRAVPEEALGFVAIYTALIVISARLSAWMAVHRAATPVPEGQG